jgi:hypothetical protein
MSHSAALTSGIHADLRGHLLREDGQEDLCFAIWRPSSSDLRTTALIDQVVLPRSGERHVHGTASFETAYFLRAAEVARAAGGGLAFLHSHPGGTGWQGMSAPDRKTEERHAPRAKAITGLPLVGLTMAGDGKLSARFWDRESKSKYARRDCESVRITGLRLEACWHPQLRPKPPTTEHQVRTVSAWGDDVQADIARLRVGVIGAGSVGAMVAESLARSGVQDITLIDFDTVEIRNLDRLIHASELDARLARSKVESLARALKLTATAAESSIQPLEFSVVEDEGFRAALDCDVLFSCVDRPWPRFALNYLAFAHLIPVVYAGIRIVTTRSGRLRIASWRAHVATPGRRCLECLGQYRRADVTTERDGLLDDPEYIKRLPDDHSLVQRQNVFAFSQAASALAVEQFLRMVVAPGNLPDVGAQRHQFKLGTTDLDVAGCEQHCIFAKTIGSGDESLSRFVPTGAHALAADMRKERAQKQREFPIRIKRWADDWLGRLRNRL